MMSFCKVIAEHAENEFKWCKFKKLILHINSNIEPIVWNISFFIITWTYLKQQTNHDISRTHIIQKFLLNCICQQIYFEWIGSSADFFLGTCMYECVFEKHKIQYLIVIMPNQHTWYTKCKLIHKTQKK
jgi:hypothetical protein